jgi:two-component system, LytTR family, sensor kinase
MGWILLHFITFSPSLLNENLSGESFVFTHFVLVTVSFLLFYIVAFYIIPNMGTLQKKWFWVLIGSLVLAILFTYLKFRLEAYHTEYILNKNRVSNTSLASLGFFSNAFGSYVSANVLMNVSIVVVAFAYRLLLTWFQQEKIKRELENQKLQAELSYLRMQVNPHFLFNALNNIYSLAVTENSKRTSSSILQLSELMRYILYEIEDAENKVSLTKEIHYLNNYIELEKLRHAEEIYFHFSIEGDIENKRIAPLLIFPLVENAFKHGVLTDINKPVTLYMKVIGHRINFSIVNFNNDYKKDKSGGIGIKNVKKRLDLIYGDKYTMDIDHTKEKHIVNLNLPL